jgi:hypothetical protein
MDPVIDLYTSFRIRLNIVCVFCQKRHTTKDDVRQSTGHSRSVVHETVKMRSKLGDVDNREAMDHSHYRLNFDLNKSRQKFYHSLKEHHKISNIPKFRCEML